MMELVPLDRKKSRAKVVRRKDANDGVFTLRKNMDIADRVPHASIGEQTFRVPVHARARQFEVMVTAVQNPNPEAIVIDEIGTAGEVEAAMSIGAHGVQLVATGSAWSQHRCSGWQCVLAAI